MFLAQGLRRKVKDRFNNLWSQHKFILIFYFNLFFFPQTWFLTPCFRGFPQAVFKKFFIVVKKNNIKCTILIIYMFQ